jgi:hypothetical protein
LLFEGCEAGELNKEVLLTRSSLYYNDTDIMPGYAITAMMPRRITSQRVENKTAKWLVTPCDWLVHGLAYLALDH